MKKMRLALNFTPELGLGLLVILSLISNIIWIYTDNLLGPEADSKIYFLKTLNFMDQLKIGLLTS